MPPSASSAEPRGAPRQKSAARKRIVQVAQVAITLAIIVGVFFFFLPSIADYSDVWATIKQLTWLEFATLFAITVLNIVTYWTQMMAFMPGLTLGQAAVNNQSSTTIANTLPGGGAIAIGVAYAMFRSWGFTDASIVLFTLDTGIWNMFLKLGLPVIALGLLAVGGFGTGAALIPALIGFAALVGSVIAFALMLRSESLARSIGSGLGRAAARIPLIARKRDTSKWGEAAVRFRAQTNALAERRWIVMTLTTLISHLSLYLVLLVTLRHVGVSEDEVSWIQVLAVFAFGRLASAVPFSPGGIGVVEAVYIQGLVLAGGAHAPVVAAVLVFRALTYGIQIPLGAITYLVWQRKKSWRKRPPDHEPEETEASTALLASSKGAQGEDDSAVQIHSDGAAGGDDLAAEVQPQSEDPASHEERAMQPRYRRRLIDLIPLVGGIAILLVSAMFVEAGSVGALEASVFRFFNDLPIPDFLYWGVWGIMQLGNIVAVPATAVAAAVTRRFRLAIDIALAGGTVYVVAKVVKRIVTRGRPQALLEDVNILGEAAKGLGFVSGHAAVAVALATVAGPYFGRPGKMVLWSLAIGVCVFRMYVGAHLPLDVTGGAGLGLAAGGLVHLLLGAPSQQRAVDRKRTAAVYVGPPQVQEGRF